MGFRAALDASVLVPMPLCDTLLHMAEAELFDPSEVLRNPPRSPLEVVRTLLPWAPGFVGAVEERIT